MPPSRRLLAFSFAAGFALHAAAALALWQGWRPGVRSLWLVWIDLPWSLLWLDAGGHAVLAWSLVVGGLWWGALTAGLTLLVGDLARRQRGGR